MKSKKSELWNQILKSFILYALTPLLCVAVTAVSVFARGEGIYSLECLLTQYSIEALAERMALNSGVDEKEKNDEGGALYFLPPLTDAASGLLPEEIRLQVMTSIPEGMLPIIKADLSSKSVFINTTKYELDKEELLKDAQHFDFEKTEPLVLVLHTHTTEGYYEGPRDIITENAVGYYDPVNDSPRSSDPQKSVVAVGEELCRVLGENGIASVHCTEINDSDFNKSYQSSYYAALEYLEKYPSVKYVIDIHRDSIIRENGDKLCPVTTLDGEEVAQVMLVMGTDESGYSHPSWRKNMADALLFKEKMDEMFPGLSRPIYVRDVRFNQHVSTGAMLLEMGSCGNTVEQAIRSAKYCALALAAAIKGE